MLVVVQKFVYGFLYKIFGFYINIVGVTERFTNILKNSSTVGAGRESNRGPALRKASVLITLLRHTPNIYFGIGGTPIQYEGQISIN
jgi:hypothetical protein